MERLRHARTLGFLYAAGAVRGVDSHIEGTIVSFHPTIRTLSSVCFAVCLCSPSPARAEDDPAIVLRVSEGRPMEIVLEARVTVKTVGQRIAGTLVDPLYAYDRIVVPAGTTVLGQIAALEQPSTLSRTRAMLAGDFTPRRRVVLAFDTLVLPEGPVPIRAIVKTEIPHLKKTTAPAPPRGRQQPARGREGPHDT